MSQAFFSSLKKIENISSRNEITILLSGIFADLTASEVAVAVYLLQGRIAPSYAPIEFGMSDKSVLATLNTIAQEREIEFDSASEFKRVGDIGKVCETLLHAVLEQGKLDVKDIASEAVKNLASEDIGLDQLHTYLLELTKLNGAGSQQLKQDKLKQLLLKLPPVTAGYVARVIVGELRLGLSDKTIFDSLSWFVTGSKKYRELIEQAYGARSDLGYIASLVKMVVEKFPENTAARSLYLSELLSAIKLEPGTPVASKLCERESTAVAVFERLQSCILQPKLDGMRAQIHFDRQNQTKAIFSRNQESLTDAFPDILEVLSDLDCDSCIIDSEVVGYDYESDSYLSYQETMTRRRKHDVAATASAVPLKAMAFDLLYLNGEDLTKTAVEDRVAKLKTLINQSSKQNRISFLETVEVTTPNALSDYFVKQITQGLEGVLCKKIGTVYAPGSRNYDWIKLKANTQTELVDTVDVVVIGYFAGNGDRSAYGFGSLLTAIYDPATDRYFSVAKVGSGFTDESAPTVRADLEALRVDSKPANVEVVKSLTPDYWVTPKIVIEVVADEITRSPAHTAANAIKADFEKELTGKGLSLRFPRIKVWNRDKRADQATTAVELIKMFELRKRRLTEAKSS